MRYRIGDRIAAIDMDERGFITRTEAIVEDLDEDDLYYIARPVKVRCYHPCLPDGGRDLPASPGLVMFTEKEVL